MKSISILHVTNNYRPYSGGVARSVETLHNAFLNRGLQSHVVTLNFTGQDFEEYNVVRIPGLLKFRYRQNPMIVPYRLRYYLKRIMQELRPDIIHTHHPFLLGSYALYYAQRMNIPIVFTYHTRYEEYTHYVPLPHTITRSFIERRLHYICSRVNGIITPSRSMSDSLSRYAHKTTIIPSPLRQEFAALKPLVKACSAPIRLLTVSRFAQEKNIPFLLRACKTLNKEQFHLTLVGYGAELNNLKKYAFTALQLPETAINFVIKPSAEKLLEIYQNADIFIFASKTETQGLVLAEAMAASLPIIALEASGSSDIVQTHYNGVLVQSENEMRKAIEFLAYDREVYQLYSQNAYVTGNNYRLNTIVPQFIEYYHELIKNF